MNLFTDTSAENTLCSVASKASGEDPVGTAGTHDQWFIFELPQPWVEEFWLEQPEIAAWLPVAKQRIEQTQLKLRPLAIASDRDYSSDVPAEHVRLLHYRRPGKLFARYEKREYVVPVEELGSLAIALMDNARELSRFETYRHDSNAVRELLVCTHGNVDVACSRFGFPIYRALRTDVTKGVSNIRVWRCSHFGGHRFAPTLIDLPEGHYWGHLEPAVLEQLVRRNGEVSELRRFYRGWSGLAQLEQIAEREMLMQHGWSWFDYLKAGQTLAMDEEHREWAEVRVDFAEPDGGANGRYEARVEATGEVETLGKSGGDRLRVKQYRAEVSRVSVW